MPTIFASKGQPFLVDQEDFHAMEKVRWVVHRNGYAVTYAKHKSVFMHRLINRTPAGFSTDHINGDKQDNRRVNLRTCSQGQNSINSRRAKLNKFGHKGISAHRNKFKAVIQLDYVKYYLGLFYTVEEAISAYQKAAKILHGEFTNFS